MTVRPSVPNFLPGDCQYVWREHVVDNKKRTRRVDVVCLCGLYLLMIDQHSWMMLPKCNLG